MELQSIKLRYGIIGNSSGLNNALSIAMRVAPTPLSVLILGESGVGKEVFSQIIHSLSPRKHNNFIAVNCGAIPEGTIDSELFGHEKGAFTGATDSRKGYFEVVNGGTIFLDEIGEMPLGTQARLLRMLESGEFIKVGSSKTQKTDVRIVAATNVNLREAVGKGKFREDLYYRLSTVPIQIPSLRERREDIYLLFRKFTVDFAERHRTTPISLDEPAKDALVNYHWPGNIRELKNIAEQISVLSSDRKIGLEELLQFLPQATPRLPSLSGRRGSKNEHFDYSERELMYNILFDMKKDIGDLKQIMLQLLGGHGNTPPPAINKALPAPKSTNLTDDFTGGIGNRTTPNRASNNPYSPIHPSPSVNPIVLHDGNNLASNRFATEEYKSAEILEESLSIAEKERELIQKALKKHKGKRKDAALDLGISERTLYRKIKEYNIKE